MWTMKWVTMSVCLLTISRRQTVVGAFEEELQDWKPDRRSDFQLRLSDFGDLPHNRRDAALRPQCGVPAISPSVNMRIVGGVEAVPHSWPWMASLQVRGDHWCGGSIINNQWILTAAHCKPRDPSDARVLEVVVGLHRRSDPDEYAVRIPVSRIIPHHKFGRRPAPWASRLELSSDLMLLKLAHPITFNEAVSPVCLPDQLFQTFPAGKRCYSSGWGRLSTRGDSPDELMQVMLPLLSRDVCNQPGWHDFSIDDSMICAGFEQGERGNCYGDSGGPLVCQDDGRWVLYGAVSWGSLRGCAATEGPTVYARVSAYLRWIEETINENSD